MFAPQVLHQGGDVFDWIDCEVSGQGSFGGGVGGDIELGDSGLYSGQGHREHTRDGAQGPGEGELPHKGGGAVRLAGAKLMVILDTGKAKPQFLMAARTRSRASRTAASGRPTISKAGRPLDKSHSALTS